MQQSKFTAENSSENSGELRQQNSLDSTEVAKEDHSEEIKAESNPIQLKDELKATVRPQDAAIAIGTVIILLSLIAINSSLNLINLDSPHYWMLLLGFLWTSYIIALFRMGKRVLNPVSIAYLLALTLWGTSNLLPDTSMVKPWLDGLGTFLFGVNILLSLFKLNFHRREKRKSSPV